MLSNTKWICILGPSVETTREFINKLDLKCHKKIKLYLSKEYDFDCFDMYLKTTHMMELVNYFSMETEQPDLIISDYSFLLYLTQIEEHTPLSINMHNTWEKFCFNFISHNNIPRVSKYFVMHETVKDSSYDYNPKEYLKCFVQYYLKNLPTTKYEYINNDNKGIQYVQKQIETF